METTFHTKTKEILDHHVSAFIEADVEEILKDFSEHSEVLTPQGAVKGLPAIRSLFEGIFKIFIKQGRVCNNYLFLENGFIRSYTFDLDGNEVTTEFYSSGQIVFEVGSFFQKTSSKENFQALEDSYGWYIDFDQLQMLFHSIP